MGEFWRGTGLGDLKQQAVTSAGANGLMASKDVSRVNPLGSLIKTRKSARQRIRTSSNQVILWE